MKKAISTILALVMVLAVVAAIPMTASAATTVVHTSKYFAPNSTTNLDAFYATPAIGTWLKNSTDKSFGSVNGTADLTTLKDAAWDNAIKYTYTSSASDYDMYILWDNDNLYILQDNRKMYSVPSGQPDKTLAEVKTCGKNLGVWDTNGKSTLNVEHSYYQILLPREMTNLGDAAKRPVAYAVGAIPCLNDAAVADYDIYEGAVLVRDFEYSSTTGVTGNKNMFSWQSTFDAGVRTFVERLTEADGKTTTYRTATVIPWTFVDSTPDEAFANLTKEAKTNQTIGVWVFHNGAKHIYHDGYYFPGKTGTDTPNDTAGFDTVTLYNSKSDIPAASTNKIEPDYDHWVGANGQFTKTSPVTMADGKATGSTTATYYIEDAGDLLALANILESVAYNDSKLSNFKLQNKDSKAYLSRNKTFVLTNDIDLNPHVTDWDEVNAYLVRKYSGEYVDNVTLTSPLPENVFVGFDRFFGVLDGQGHAIKGLYNPDAILNSNHGNGITPAQGAIVGQLGQGGLKNLYIESGFYGSGRLTGNKMVGGLVAEIRTESYTDYTNASIVFENIYVGESYTVYRWGVATDTSSYAYGAVACSVWPGVGNKGVTIKATFNNIVYSGDMLDHPTNMSKSYAKDVVLANNFGANNETKTVSNGSTKIECKFSNIYANVDETTASNAITSTRYTKVVKGSGIPEGKETEMAVMADGGIAPILVADMAAKTRWQATTVGADGRFNVRFVSEVDASDLELFETIGHFITITATKGDETMTYEVDFTENSDVYKSVIADGKTVTADSAEFAVKGGTHLIASVISLKAEEGVTYSIDIVTCYDGTDGYVQNIGVVAPWN